MFNIWLELLDVGPLVGLRFVRYIVKSSRGKGNRHVGYFLWHTSSHTYTYTHMHPLMHIRIWTFLFWAFVFNADFCGFFDQVLEEWSRIFTLWLIVLSERRCLLQGVEQVCSSLWGSSGPSSSGFTTPGGSSFSSILAPPLPFFPASFVGGKKKGGRMAISVLNSFSFLPVNVIYVEIVWWNNY